MWTVNKCIHVINNQTQVYSYSPLLSVPPLACISASRSVDLLGDQEATTHHICSKHKCGAQGNSREGLRNDRNGHGKRTVSKERQGSSRRDESRGRKREAKKGEGSDGQLKCFRCGSNNHLANKCPIYKSRSPTPCRDCKLDHKTSDCKTPKNATQIMQRW